MASKMGYMRFLRKKMAEGGEVGGDPGYGQSYNRKNSHGEPHTNQYFEDEHPMSYMADGGDVEAKDKKPAPPQDLGSQISANMKKAVHNINSQGQPMADGGMVSHYNSDSNHPDPDHDEQTLSVSPGMDWDEQMGEPYPVNAHDNEESPDLSYGDAMDEEMANFAEGGMAYHKNSGFGEKEDGQMSPDMSDSDAMSHEMAGLGRQALHKMHRTPMKKKIAHHSHGGMAHFAHALKKGMK